MKAHLKYASYVARHKWFVFRAGLKTAPRGYLAWHEWAEEKGKTHVQRRCPGCTLFSIWVPKEAA